MRLKLSQKIPFLVALAALVSGLVVAYAGYGGAATELRGAAAERLQAVLSARRLALADYLAEVQRDLGSQATSPPTLEAMDGFAAGWREPDGGAGKRLRQIYGRGPASAAAEPSTYDSAHRLHHRRLQTFIEQYGYTDLLLIDTDGVVVYSVMKHDDFATNVTTGPSRGTGLDKAYRAAVAAPPPATQAFFDYEYYQPADGRPTAFIAQPIRDDRGGLKGILALALPTAPIDRIVQGAAGLGRTGEVFVVGPEHLVRGGSRTDLDGALVARFRESEPIRRALNGEAGVILGQAAAYEPLARTEALIAFEPLEFMGTPWAFVAVADLAEVFAPVDRMRRRALMHGGFFALLVAVVGVLLTRSAVVVPLTAVAAAMRQLAAGNSDVALPPVRQGDEICDIAAALALFRDNLVERDRLAAEREQARRVEEVRRQLAQSIEAISDGFALYDESGYLVLANSKYRQIYHQSAGMLVPGVRYEDYIRHSAAVGEIIEANGQVDQWVADRLDQFRHPGPAFEGQLADGRWLRVSDHRTEDGGTVCIRTDITEFIRREHELRDSEQRFRAIAAALPIPMVITRHGDHRVVFANPHCLDTFKVEADAAPGLAARDFYADPADRARLIRELAENGSVENFEVVMRRADGSTFPALLSVQRMMHEGEPANLNAVIDISALKATEAALRESEARVRAIIDNAADAIITFDSGRDGRVLEFNPAAERVFARRRSEVIGQPISPAIMSEGHRFPPGDLHPGGRVEIEARRADGAVFPAECTLTEVPLAGRQVLTAYLRDITDRRRAEQELVAYREHLEDLVDKRAAALKAAEERLITAINTFNGGFVLYDAEERLVVVNEMVRVFMPEVKTLPLASGVRLEDVTRTIAAANGLGENWVRDRLALYRGPEEFNAERELPDGRWVESSVRHTPDGSTLFVITDITQHKKAEGALRQALDREKELSQLQREFVSMTSHEFRTPLAIIDASIQRMVRRKDTLAKAEFDDLGREIRDAVSRMVGLIDAILSASRFDSGTIRFNPMPCDLAGAITGVCKRQSAIAPAHRFEVDVVRLPSVVVGDPVLLEQVITNLVSNSVKYSPSGGIIQVKGWTEDDLVVFSVSDTGVGIPASELPRLFQRFFRARTSTGIAGTGIGLHIVKKLVEMHGGGIHADSSEGKGTTITVHLPAHPTASGLPAHLRDKEMEQGAGI